LLSELRLNVSADIDVWRVRQTMIILTTAVDRYRFNPSVVKGEGIIWVRRVCDSLASALFVFVDTNFCRQAFPSVVEASSERGTLHILHRHLELQDHTELSNLNPRFGSVFIPDDVLALGRRRGDRRHRRH